MVTVTPIDSTTFEVMVERATTTTHKVTVTAPYYEKLTGKRITPEILVEKSFRFLLDRENQRPPAEMALGRGRGHLCWWPLIFKNFLISV